MNFYPSIYVINSRILIKRFRDSQKKAGLKDIPETYWKKLHGIGIDYVWLIGIWETTHSSIKKYCFEKNLIADYKKALPDWTPDDVEGSPYAIDDYNIYANLGTAADLITLKRELNSFGLKLILDFIPNHFNAESSLIKSIPQLFLSAEKKLFQQDGITFFQSDKKNIFAHGRDPYFSAWQDTVQINYFSEEARNIMTDKLFGLADLCDGVRCDMAMLLLNDVFYKTWEVILKNSDYKKPADEFWESAIKKVKSKRENFIFIAEAYWGLEKKLQELGFDFTYDKKLIDLMKENDIGGIKFHLASDKKYSGKSVRFIENHDEERSIKLFGEEKALASAVLMSTVPGMRFYFDGQFEGKTTKLPVQLGREPIEHANGRVKKFYDKLLSITNRKAFKSGEWKLLSPSSSGGGDLSFENILAWEIHYLNQQYIIVINFRENDSYCRLKFDAGKSHNIVKLNDLLNDDKYQRSADEIIREGLFVKLVGYQSHIFFLSN